MPRIGTNLLDCVFYLYQSKEDARNGDSTGGCGFLFPLAYDPECPVEGIHLYAVTNAHLVNLDPSFPIIRLRRRDGQVNIIDTEGEGGPWIRHPNGDDIAVCLLQLDSSDALRLITPKWHKRPRPDNPGVDENGEILGRDVVMVGRLIGHDGKETNVPVLRFGNVSALPVEPIQHPGLHIKQESFLVEMRSLSGFSGAPVFVLPDPWNQMVVDPFKEKMVQWRVTDASPYSPRPILDVRDVTLLGINWCHLDSRLEKLVNKAGEPTEDDSLYVKSSSGMAGVVPWWKLWELFDDADVKETRKMIEDRAARDKGVSV